MSSHATPARASVLRPAAGLILAGFAVAAVVFAGFREAARSAQAARPPAAPAPALPAGSATVYYFHGDARCHTCLMIEWQAANLIESEFAEEIADGRLMFLAVNYDLPENRHFREDYRLPFSSVVVTDGTRWENLSEVWTLVHDDPAAFDAYLTARIRPFVDADP